MHALQDTFSPAPQQQRSMDAFRRYVRTVRQVWTEIDPDALEAPVVAAIAQSMLSAAWTLGGAAGFMPVAPAGASTAARHDQKSEAGVP
jgi:hypothetical protein